MTLDDKTRAIVEAALGYAFKDASLAEQALTHRSLLAEHKAKASNEPLEFLGDAVLGFVIAEMLHRRDPLGAEGDKTRIRARLVSTPTLVGIGRSFDVGSLIRMSAGEEKNDGRTHEKVQEDAVEALIAAVYLDGGIEAARAVVARLFEPRLNEGSLASKDAKGALQEFLQARGLDLPTYEIESLEGPQHRQRHRVVCNVGGEVLGRGAGASRKKAELVAAEQALAVLKGRTAGA
ncbi:MAG TPA: ribonuclease III [Vicinamibacteria bacterium]|nr:ribonuclease III [Vicinamibacteria bacterium]